MRGTYTLVKVETDAGVYGIGEARPDITGLGVKDAVLNGFRQMLIGQDPFDIDRLTTQMMWRVSYMAYGPSLSPTESGICRIQLSLADQEVDRERVTHTPK